jgi:uncharacterized protein
MATRPVADNLFEEGAEPRLIGGRHRETGVHVFPFPAGLEAAEYDRVALAPEGALWSWTIQRFRPKSPPYIGPEAFEPYAVGYVELAGQVIVETRLVNVDFDRLAIGDAYRTAIIPFAQDADGTAVLTYAFEPVEGSHA